MATLLEEAFARARELPEAEQDRIAGIVMAELEEDWLDRAVRERPDVLDRLVAEARAEIRSGR